jgi:hypothetical protein
MATFWRSFAPAAAIFISLAAAVFSGLQWLETREQAFLATKPHVDFDIEDDSDEPMVGIAIMNAGPGPASIKAITFYVDRKPVAGEKSGASFIAVAAAGPSGWRQQPHHAAGERRHRGRAEDHAEERFCGGHAPAMLLVRGEAIVKRLASRAGRCRSPLLQRGFGTSRCARGRPRDRITKPLHCHCANPAKSTLPDT